MQLLSTFQRNPPLLERVAGALGAAPALADYLARVPSALEGLLAPAVETAPSDMLARQLADARALEDVIAITSRLVRAEEFRLCCAQMDGGIDVNEAGFARTALADAALQVLLPAVLAEHERRYAGSRQRHGGRGSGQGRQPGDDGRLRPRPAAALHPSAAVTESTGGRSLPASQWFIRAAHAIVAALTAPGADGPLYAVDMRLRPSGNKGPVAVSLAGFGRYHEDSAWTWNAWR